PRTVSGYVYVNGVVTKPDKVTLSIGTQQVTATLFNDGYYIIDFSEEDGETGTFTVTVDGKDYLAPETITLLQGVYAYYIDLTVDVPAVNHLPSKPVNPSPIDGVVDVSITTSLSVDVYDPDGDNMNVYFYWDNGTMIGVDTNVPSGGTASIGPLSLSYDTQYHWYAIANDTQFENKSSTWSFTTKPAPVNHPPSKPSNPTPSDEATGVSVNTALSWQCNDPDGDPLTYDVYFGTTTNPPKVSNNQSSTLYDLDTLQYSTTYYWKIVAWDNKGAKNESNLWNFTTEPFVNHPPDVPHSPSPENNATNVSTNTTLSWYCSDPDGDDVAHDVYFGTSNPPPKASSNQSSTNYDPGTLNYSTTYYWRIVAWDEHGDKTTGPVWHFTTESPPINHPPDKPSNPSPANNSKNISINPILSVLVTDPDGDLLDVHFYNALDDSLIGTVDNVPNGSVATIHWNGLDYNQTYQWYVIVNDSEFEVKSDTWNFGIIPKENQPPHVEIIKPVNAIYFRDRRITKFFLPIIIGKITVEANATDSDGTIEKVEFFIDNVSKYNDTTEPYSWLWNERIFGFHTITVVAYDNDGRSTEVSRNVLIFNFHIL
ncbi:MAG: hypothetical protein J7K13_02410, partial [Thermoplasmata archaeon]|nr:hypothetical protein [Thermoplasmata archaeon]